MTTSAFRSTEEKTKDLADKRNASSVLTDKETALFSERVHKEHINAILNGRRQQNSAAL